MSRSRLSLLILVTLSGCGYVGEPLPPLLNIPEPVIDLAAVQRGPRIIAHFTLPKLTTEGRVAKNLHWELRAGEQGTGEFHIEEWATRARSLGQAPEKNGAVEYDFAAAPWIGKEVVLAARTRGPSGRLSAWSKPLVLSILAPPATPHDLKAENVPDGVRLTWQGAGPAYRVLRRVADEPDFIVVGDTTAPEFIDRVVEYGKTVRYVVEAIVKTGAGEVESDLSAEYDFVPKDVFPPAAPTGLTAVPTTNTIELTWDRSMEPDLAGYRVYRAAAGGEFEKIAETLDAGYSDHKVESGKTYRYAVSAFDKSNNESQRSEPIEVAVP